MNPKNLLKKRVIIWGASTLVLVGVLVAANIVARTVAKTIISEALNDKPKPIFDETKEGVEFERVAQTKKEATAQGDKITEKICEEGMVLLKNENNALPLKKNAKISVFGKNSVNLVAGGSGSAAPGESDPKTIFESLTSAGFSYNKALEDFYKDNKKSGEGRSKNPAMDNGGVDHLETGETPIVDYPENVTSTYGQYGDAALIVFSRIAGENWDLPRKAVVKDENGRTVKDSSNKVVTTRDHHYLELDKNEQDLIKHVCDSGKFEHVIVLLNGSNYIDCGFLKLNTDPNYNAKIDAAINIGSTGGSGIMALGRILAGTVNPSGHTVDTVYTDYKTDPTWQNFGGNFQDDFEGDAYLSKTTGNSTNYYFVEYEENIYLGYRYYETRYAEIKKASGQEAADAWYNSHVLYPFGYGLSYTTFSQEIVNKADLAAALDKDTPFDVEIKVKNTGEVAGKQVVQLYVTTPFTENGIEKADKVLVGFAKTGLLEKNGEETVKITVNPYDFASFDSHDKNSNGKKCYELDAGDYVFHAGTDVHHDFDTFTKNLAATAVFENDPTTNTPVTTLFDDVTENMKESLSRNNFEETFPHTVTLDERKIAASFLNKLKSKETTNDEEYTTLPTMGVDEITCDLFDLVGKPYNDAKWDEFLNQLTFADYLKLFNEGCYSTGYIQKGNINLVPATTSADGPTGLVSFLGNVLPGGKPAVYGCCYYCSECLVAQTYNPSLAEEQGICIGEEALVGNERGDGLSYPGWYAPGVNLHRSPFSGRNTEYYSEDPFISGKFAAKVIQGVQSKGVYANVKHFAINDQETHRSKNGISSWVDEQAMRELYFKPFETAVKEGKTRGLMTSFNRIGYEWAGGSYRLVTKVLREEWGFVGSVICDFHTDKYMDCKQMLYAGGDLNLASLDTEKMQTSNKYGTPYVSANDPMDANLLRQAAHRVCYCVANSNAMAKPIKGYNPANWEIALTAGTIGLSVILLGWGAAAICTALFAKDKKKEEAAE